MDNHQFSNGKRLINLKRHLKKVHVSSLNEIHFSLRETLLKPKIDIPNLDSRQCFCNKRLFYPKRHLKGNYYMLFQENDSSSFSRHALTKYKIGIPNLYFNEFLCCKGLMFSVKHVNRCLFIEFEENH